MFLNSTTPALNSSNSEVKTQKDCFFLEHRDASMPPKAKAGGDVIDGLEGHRGHGMQR